MAAASPTGRRLPTLGRYEHPFLPTTRAEMAARGWDELDVIIVSGDAYVDHPAFGPPLIGRFLEKQGFRVGMIAQPDWRSAEDFRRLGRPRLCFGVAAGNLDSMLNRLTAQKKVRSTDQYSPGGRTGCRPDRATLVYAQRCKEAFAGVPVVLGGIEASLRRIAHYDYWSDTVRRPIVLDAKADLLVFGMGEAPIWEVCRRLRDGQPISEIRDVRGTCFPLTGGETARLAAGEGAPLELPSYEAVAGTDEAARAAYARMARLFHKETNPLNARPLWQRVGDRAVYFNPPALALDEAQMDAIYDLPFNRVAHPSYVEPIPALEQVRHSIVTMRGCFGGCTFCSITEHEGRAIQSRSVDSILREVRALRRLDDFRGVISDLGGPTANMYQMRCGDPEAEKACRRLSCIHPSICKKLDTDHGPVIELMKRVREADGVRKVFVASGVRYDLAALSPDYIGELATHHTGGQLSVAPEHVSERVLDLMKKPGKESYEAFASEFSCASERAGKEQYLVPYYISGHPGSSLEDMIDLALYLRSRGLRPRQVQDFIPTPMSLAATMYWSGLDPLSGKPVYTAKGLREKRLQKALLLYWDAEQAPLVREALLRAGRLDLIGHGPEHLVAPGPLEDGRHLRGGGGGAATAQPGPAPTAGANRRSGRRPGRRRPASA
jgi:uncharacterized radical SAM protein YgiQ